MRFNEFRDRLKKAHEKVATIALYPITETISVDGNSITVSIGKEYGAEINGNSTDIRYLRHNFTNAKPEFEAMLESLESSAEEVSQAMGVLVPAIADEVVPEMVLKRISGDQVEGSSQALLESLLRKKLTELHEIFSRGGIFETFGFKLSITKDVTLILEGGSKKRQYLQIQLKKDTIFSQRLASEQVEIVPFTIETGLNCIAMMDLIKAKLIDFVSELEKLRKFHQEE